MRLDELTRPPWDDALEILTNAGYQLVGEGGSANVYGRDDKDYVLKVFSARDWSYIQYLGLVAAHPENPHSPRIRGRLVKVNDEYHAVRLEKLTRYSGDDQIIGWIKNYIHAAQRNQSLPRGTLPETLCAACRLIAGLKSQRGHVLGLDLKADNVMMRGATLVLIDPVL